MPNPSDNNAALIRAQQMMKQLREGYLAELPERVNELEQLALDLKLAGNFVQQYDELYRKTHSLKGGAGTYGLQIISNICHQLEGSLTSIANDSSKADDIFIDRCIAYFDLMRSAIKGATQGKTSFPEIEEALTGMRTSATGKRLTALLVEHSRMNSTLFQGMLKDLPVTFTVVDSGYAALGLLLHDHFDLLITGNETPMLNGMALITAVRLNQGMNHDICAILLTSSTGLQIPQEALPVIVINRDAHIAAGLHDEVQGYLRKLGVAR